MKHMNRRDWVKALNVRLLLTIFVLGNFGTEELHAHAVLIESQPASNAKVRGGFLPIVLKFNSRVDQSRSTLVLEGPGQTTCSLKVKEDSSSPEKLLSEITDAKAGFYKVRWQVLSADGHITRGQISFEVQ